MEDEVKDLLEDLDLQTLIHEDLRENRPDDTFAIAEAAERITDLETQIARLLGQEAPPAVAPRTAPVSRADTPATPAAAVTTDVSPRRHDPSYNLAASPLRSTSRDRIAEPLSTSHWPSSALSPFIAPSNQPRLHLPNPVNTTGKRPRQDSLDSLTPAQTSKRAVLANSRSRMAEIDESLEAQLAQNRQLYEDLLGDVNVQFTANTENISEEQAREKIRKDREESEREIRQQFQLERDGELARLLQAQQFESSDDERDFDRHPTPNPLRHFTPSSTLSPGRTLPRPLYNLPDRTHSNGSANVFPNLPRLMNHNNRNGFDYNGFDFSSNPPQPMPWGVPDIPTNGFDDDLQEITPDSFHSRVGGPPPFGPPAMHGRTPPRGPLAMPGRILPWMPEPDPRLREIYMRDPYMRDPYMRDPNGLEKAMDLVRDQMELDVDDEDFV